MKSKILKATALFLAEIRIFLKNKLSFDEKKTISPDKTGDFLFSKKNFKKIEKKYLTFPDFGV